MAYCYPATRSVLYIIFDIFTICLIISSLSLSIVHIALTNVSNGYVKEIEANWEYSPIYDISFSNEASSLTTQGSFGQWDGIVFGCDCTTSSFLSHETFRGETCSSRQLFWSCIDVKEIPPVPFLIWRGQPIVTKTKGSDSYYTLLEKADKKGCTSGYKSCGILDSTNHKMCVPELDSCPINKIIIDKNEKGPQDGFTYSNLPFGDGYHLHYTNENINGNIVVSFKATEGNVCSDSLKIDFTSSRYAFDRYYSSEGCNTKDTRFIYDTRYSKIDTVSKNTTYVENNVDKMLDKIKSNYFNGTLNLYYRNYIGANENKVEKINSRDYKDLSSFKTGFGIVLLSLSGGVLIIFLFSFIPRPDNKIPGDLNQSIVCFIVFMAFVIFIFFTNIVLSSICLSQYAGKDKFNNLDVITVKGMENYLNYMSLQSKILLGILLSNILLLLLNGFWVLNEFFFKQEYRRSALNENANNNNGYKQISNDFPPTVASANYLTNINA